MKKYKSFAQRKLLIQQLPLDVPLGIHICPSTHCNFKCHYCKHSQDTISMASDARGGGHDTVGKTGWLKREFMDMDLYCEIIRQIAEFPNKVKILQFAWLGEPMLHPHIAEMVKIAKEANVAETVSIVTNGSVLTNKMSDDLIAAGLDRLRISLQGLNAEDYWKIAEYKVDWKQFVDNIKYFYDNKRDTQVYIKIMDVMLRDEKDEAYFQQTFADICDVLNIEHLVPLHNELDLSDIKEDFSEGYFGNKLDKNMICSYVFYFLVVTPDGTICPCPCSDQVYKEEVFHHMGMSNVREESIRDFWKGKRLHDFRMSMIHGEREQFPVCEQCSYPLYHTAVEDQLDRYQQRLEEIYSQFEKGE